MRNVFGHCVVTLVLVLGGARVDAAEPTQDSLQLVKQNLTAGKAVLLDVRELDEWNEGHLAVATLLPLSRIERGVTAEQLVKTAPREKIIYLHCALGSRCLTAADLLKKSGRDVRPLKQGYATLLKSGFRSAAN
jgi:rhodanese-related sulfurtransferase